MLLKPGYIAIVLANIEKRIPTVRKRLEERITETRLDDILRAIAHALEHKNFTLEQLTKGLHEIATSTLAASPASKQAPKLHRNIWFTEHALLRMRQRNIVAGQIHYNITKALGTGLVEAKRLPNSYHAIRTREGTRIVFSVRGDKIVKRRLNFFPTVPTIHPRVACALVQGAHTSKRDIRFIDLHTLNRFRPKLFRVQLFAAL